MSTLTNKRIGDWFRPMQGSVEHLCVGYESGSFGFLNFKTACGKVFIPNSVIENSERKCKKCISVADKMNRVSKNIQLP